MALLYDAQISPSKMEALASWLPAQLWWVHGDATVEAVGAYRFDDPADEVGVETHLVRVAGGPIVQVPVTYRDAPLDGAEDALISPMQHSVLGPRWVYDACSDPVYVSTLITVILTGGTQAELQIASAGGLTRRDPTVRVSGSGVPGTAVPPIGTLHSESDQTQTRIRTAALDVVVLRLPGSALLSDTASSLTGVWPGQDEPVVLATARVR